MNGFSYSLDSRDCLLSPPCFFFLSWSFPLVWSSSSLEGSPSFISIYGDRLCWESGRFERMCWPNIVWYVRSDSIEAGKPIEGLFPWSPFFVYVLCPPFVSSDVPLSPSRGCLTPRFWISEGISVFLGLSTRSVWGREPSGLWV